MRVGPFSPPRRPERCQATLFLVQVTGALPPFFGATSGRPHMNPLFRSEDGMSLFRKCARHRVSPFLARELGVGVRAFFGLCRMTTRSPLSPPVLDGLFRPFYHTRKALRYEFPFSQDVADGKTSRFPLRGARPPLATPPPLPFFPRTRRDKLCPFPLHHLTLLPLSFFERIFSFHHLRVCCSPFFSPFLLFFDLGGFGIGESLFLPRKRPSWCAFLPVRPR